MIWLKSNGRNGIKKYENKANLYTCIHDGNDSELQFYYCENDERDAFSCYSIHKIEDNKGIILNIQNIFKEIKSTDITGKDCSDLCGLKFNPKRLIIIEMKERVEQKRIRTKWKNKRRTRK